MSAVRRNIASNLAASVWTIVLTLGITPLQVNLLGIEAYGLIGFIATLQILFTMFDLGLSSTLTRALASDHSARRRDSADLVRTSTTIYWASACLVGAALAACSGLIASRWFTTKVLTTAEVTHGLYAIALFLAARWPVALYSGVLMGWQRMDVLNVVKMGTTTLRLAGGIAVILVWPDLNVFLWWTAANALVEVAGYMLACRQVGGMHPLDFGFSKEALRAVWRFSLSISGLSLLALFIAQLDRIMLSRMLSLDDLGHYTLAYNAAAIISLGISSFSSALIPSFAAAYSRDDADGLCRQYEHANRVMLFVVSLMALPLIFFGDVILGVWVGPGVVRGSFPPLVLLTIGYWLSAILSNAYSVTVATGHPGMTLRLSALSAIPYAAGLYLLVLLDGVTGAALAWVLLNLSYVLVLVPRVHKKILKVSTWTWTIRIILPFAGSGIVAFGGCRWIVGEIEAGSFLVTRAIALLVALTIFLVAGYRFLGPSIRAQAQSLLRFKKTPVEHSPS